MTALAATPVRAVVRAVADAAARWSDADFPPRVRLLDAIVERTGYTVPVVEYALDQLFGSLTVAAIEAVIVDELGSLDVLDRFTQRLGRPDAMARPVGNVCIISSRTTIGVAIIPAIFALCAKCDVLVKDREDGLVRAFFVSLREELDAFDDAARAQAWHGESDARDLSSYDAVVAFGKDATLQHLCELTGPRTRFIGFGTKASIGYIGRDALGDVSSAKAIAQGAARDLVLYESEGCLSLHALFVERAGAVEPHAFAQLLATALERASVEFPPGTRDARAAARLSNMRNLAAFRAAGGGGAVFSDAQASYLAVLDPPVEEPPPFLPRALGVRSVDDPAQALAYLHQHRVPIEAVAVAGTRADIVNMANATGANRIAAFGELQRPPLGGNHGGRPRVAEFITWVTSET